MKVHLLLLVLKISHERALWKWDCFLPDLAPCFLKDIQEYIKQVFNSGNLDLNSKQNESLEKDDGSL